AQAAASDPGPGPEAGVPSGRVLRRGARAQRVLALPDRGHRRVPGARRPGHQAGRLLRLHLRPDRGRGTPRAARGLLLPARDPPAAGRQARPGGPVHERLGRALASAVQTSHIPPRRVTIYLDRAIGRKEVVMAATDGGAGVPEEQRASADQTPPETTAGAGGLARADSGGGKEGLGGAGGTALGEGRERV